MEVLPVGAHVAGWHLTAGNISEVPYEPVMALSATPAFVPYSTFAFAIAFAVTSNTRMDLNTPLGLTNSHAVHKAVQTHLIECPQHYIHAVARYDDAPCKPECQVRTRCCCFPWFLSMVPAVSYAGTCRVSPTLSVAAATMSPAPTAPTGCAHVTEKTHTYVVNTATITSRTE